MPVGDTPTSAQTPDGQFISWREHLIDDPTLSGVSFSGSGGLVMGDSERAATARPTTACSGWKQVRTPASLPAFRGARAEESREMPLPRD